MWWAKCAPVIGIKAALKGVSNKINSRIWGSFISSRLRPESVYKDPQCTVIQTHWIQMTHFLCQPSPKLTSNGLRRQIRKLCLSGPNSPFQVKVKFSYHLEIKVTEFGEQVQIEVFTVNNDFGY